MCRKRVNEINIADPLSRLVSREKNSRRAETIHVDMIDLRICAEEASQMYEIE